MDEKRKSEESNRKRREVLEEGLEETFPASDPPAATQPGSASFDENKQK